MKKLALGFLLTSIILLCSCSDSSNSNSNSDSVNQNSESVSDVSEISDDEIISNPKNEVGNGYVIIRDENDYPSCLKDFRYNCGGKVIDYWGNEVFSVTENDLLFSCGVSAHKFENGLYGYIDINGETVIEPVFSEARPFVNGSALVKKNDKSFYIDLNGNKSEDKTYEGYHGDLTKHDYYGTFTGQYLIYQDAGIEDFSVDYGFSDANGNDTDMPNVTKAWSFSNGFALVEATENNREEYYFIDENLERVTDFPPEIELEIYSFNRITSFQLEPDLMLGLQYIYGNGYFVVNTGEARNPTFELYKIVPELYQP